MTTYAMVLCHFCYGFGIELTTNEIAALKAMAVQAIRNGKAYSRPVEVILERASERKRCCCCKGTGWVFRNSRDARRNGIPTHTVNRWDL